MPIGRNLTLGALGSRFAAAAAAEPVEPAAPAVSATLTPASFVSSLSGGAPPVAPAAVAGVPIAPAVTVTPVADLRPALSPAVLTAIGPAVLGPLRPVPASPPASKSATQLANGAITQLANAAPAVLREAMNTVINAGVDRPANLMAQLERFVRIGEVLNDLAARWSETTRGDFAKAFNNMAADRTDVMDAIVSLAILNDPDLEAELQWENTPETTNSELVNRRVVWQSQPPGTVLEPPYVILVAVEYTDVAKAQDIVKRITDQLVLRDKFRLPRVAADRL